MLENDNIDILFGAAGSTGSAGIEYTANQVS
jgi:hypothetical protein